MTSLHRQTAWSGRTSRYRWTVKSDQQPALNNQFWTLTNSEQPTLNIIQLWTINSDYQLTLNSVPRGWVRRSRKGKGRNGRQSWGLLLEEYSSDHFCGYSDILIWYSGICCIEIFVQVMNFVKTILIGRLRRRYWRWGRFSRPRRGTQQARQTI